jgi:hypothetical protein
MPVRVPCVAAFVSVLASTLGAIASSTELHLRSGVFDPLDAPPPTVVDHLAAGADTNVFIVQLTGRTRAADLDAIRELGGAVHGSLPERAHLVRLDPAARDAVAALDGVRWVGAYHPAYRLEPALLDVTPDAGPARYGIQLFERGLPAQRRVARVIVTMGGTVERLSPGGFRMEATLDGRQLRRVVRLDDVAYVDRTGPVTHDLDVVRAVIGADFLEEIAGLTGHGVRGEIFELGVRITHCDFQSNPILLHTAEGSGGLGTAVMGAAFGDGTCNPRARGMLPDGSPIFASFFEVDDLHAHVGELVDPAGPYRAVFLNRSLGFPRTGSYTTITAEIDDVLFTHDIVMTQSMSNSGMPVARPAAWAKNVVSVGGILHRGTAEPHDDCWCGVASTGPAEDGRIKPDLVHFVDGVFTTGDGCDTCYGEVGGTSIATPIVAGAAGLVAQMWSEGLFDNPVPPEGDVFEKRAHMTTTKALLINTASRYEFDGDDHDFTRTHQGWGLPDLRGAYERGSGMTVVDESAVLALDERFETTVDVEPDAPDLRATMVYADPPGMPGATRHRINDLTLRVTSPGGVTYWGNHGLRQGNWSAPGGAPDDRDTVENVFVQTPEAGAWTVEVIAFEVNEDGHVETPGLDADFALVISGGRTPSSCPADVDGTGTVDTADLLVVLAGWGTYEPCPPYRAADVDENCTVDTADLLAVLSAWGPCTP